MLQERPDLKPLPPGKSTPAHLRQIAQIAIANNAESVARGDIIKAWQDWYAINRAAITKAIEVVAGSAKENDLAR